MMGKSRLVNGTIRQGSALVEFAALMPLFVVIAFLALEGQAMMTRWYFLSHSAYAAARRCATDQRGTSLAQGFVNRDFDRANMPGYQEVETRMDAGHPQRCIVRAKDRYWVMAPDPASDQGLAPKLRTTLFTNSQWRAEAAGTSRRVRTSDNEVP